MDKFFGDVPFEAQVEPRGCGAACLSMAYRALGRPVPQSDIWMSVSRRNAFGSVASTTHLMARDAAGRGHAAVAVQARDKLAVLRACSDAGVHAILATRLSAVDPSGHYTLLLDIDRRSVCVHDPAAGPRRILPHDSLLALWDEAPQAGEVTGGLLIAVGPPDLADRPCAACMRPAPASIPCPGCGACVGLRPLAAVGCMASGCPARMWSRICCPECDLLWEPEEDAAPLPLEAPKPAFDLAKVSAALDGFRAAALAVPGAAGHADIARLAGELVALRGALAQALAADVQARTALAAKRRAAAARTQEAIDALNARKPPPPAAPTALTLDADALGRALLERLAA